MCTTCGCGAGQARVAGEPVPAAGTADARVAQLATDPPLAAQAHPEPPEPMPAAALVHGRVATNDGGRHRHHPRTGHQYHHHDQHHQHHQHHGHDAEPVSATPALVQIEQDILAKNDGYAAATARPRASAACSRSTSFPAPARARPACWCAPSKLLRPQLPVAVIEGDQQTSNDAERIRATGARRCRSTPARAATSTRTWSATRSTPGAAAGDSVLMIENVGNLVCPAAFDLGEAHKVVVLSVTEGEDKPLKYPTCSPPRR
jgi:hydrogenase nickel incorporation protein HypB